MAKSAAEERREQAAAIAVLQQQAATYAAALASAETRLNAQEQRHTKAMDEVRADRDARAKEVADLLALIGGAVTITAAILRSKP